MYTNVNNLKVDIQNIIDLLISPQIWPSLLNTVPLSDPSSTEAKKAKNALQLLQAKIKLLEKSYSKDFIVDAMTDQYPTKKETVFSGKTISLMGLLCEPKLYREKQPNLLIETVKQICGVETLIYRSILMANLPLLRDILIEKKYGEYNISFCVNFPTSSAGMANGKKLCSLSFLFIALMKMADDSVNYIPIIQTLLENGADVNQAIAFAVVERDDPNLLKHWLGNLKVFKVGGIYGAPMTCVSYAIIFKLNKSVFDSMLDRASEGTKLNALAWYQVVYGNLTDELPNRVIKKMGNSYSLEKLSPHLSDLFSLAWDVGQWLDKLAAKIQPDHCLKNLLAANADFSGHRAPFHYLLKKVEHKTAVRSKLIKFLENLMQQSKNPREIFYFIVMCAEENATDLVQLIKTILKKDARVNKQLLDTEFELKGGYVYDDSASIVSDMGKQLLSAVRSDTFSPKIFEQHYTTIFREAVKIGNKAVVRLLIQRGVTLHPSDDYKRSLLVDTLKSDSFNLWLINRLLAEGFDPLQQLILGSGSSKRYMSVLKVLLFLEKCNTSLIRLLLKYTPLASIVVENNEENKIDFQILLIALLLDNTAFIYTLLPYYCVTEKSLNEWTRYLDLAFDNKNKFIAEALLEKILNFLVEFDEKLCNKFRSGLKENYLGHDFFEMIDTVVDKVLEKQNFKQTLLCPLDPSRLGFFNQDKQESTNPFTYLSGQYSKEYIKQLREEIKVNKKAVASSANSFSSVDDKETCIVSWANSTINSDDLNVQGISFAGAREISDDSNCFLLYPENFLIDQGITPKELKALKNMRKMFDGVKIAHLENKELIVERKFTINGKEYRSKPAWELRASEGKRYALYAIHSDQTPPETLYIPVPMEHLLTKSAVKKLQNTSYDLVLNYISPLGMDNEPTDKFEFYVPASQQHATTPAMA